MPELLLYNTQTGAVHETDCRWLRGAAGGKQPLNLTLYRVLSADDPLPTGANHVTCCGPPDDVEARFREITDRAFFRSDT